LVLQALEAGAVGYILKDTATEELLEGIREVQSGHRYLSHGLAIEVAVSRVTSWPHSLPALTSRELDVLALLAKGKTYGHIAQELDVSYKTVLNVSWQLRRKLGVDNARIGAEGGADVGCGAWIAITTLCQNLPGSFGSNIHLR
jgi:DNA-binding NarL/FixJ family response regulator